MTGIDLAGLTDVLHLKRGIITPGPVEVPRLFDRYAANLEALDRIGWPGRDSGRTMRMQPAMPMFVAAMLWGVLLLFASPASHAREPVPAYDPQGYVSDHAGVIDAEWRERIRSVCQDLERKTGVEMVVVTVPSLKPYRLGQRLRAGSLSEMGHRVGPG